jgi:hypothetical protein
VTGHCGSVGPRRSGRGSAIAAPQGAATKDNGGGRDTKEGAFGEQHREDEPTRKKDVWVTPAEEEEATGGLRAFAAGAVATSRSTSPLRRKC